MFYDSIKFASLNVHFNKHVDILIIFLSKQNYLKCCVYFQQQLIVRCLHGQLEIWGAARATSIPHATSYSRESISMEVTKKRK